MNKKRDINRAQFFEVSPEQLADTLHGAVIDKNIRLVSLPEDALIHSVAPTDFARTWKICVLSDTYDIIPEGACVPQMPVDPVCIEADDNGWSLINTFDIIENGPEYVLLAWVDDCGDERRDIGWYRENGWYTSYRAVKPTHWRPLPAPPKRA